MNDLVYRLKVFRQIGLAQPQLPHRLAIAGYQLMKWGPGFPAAMAAAAARFPRQTAIIDELGEITWAEMRDQINQLTHALNERIPAKVLYESREFLYELIRIYANS